LFLLKTVKPLIFDFNGTLFWDTSYNREAWGAIASLYRGKPFTLEETHLLNGRTNYQTVAYLLGGSCDQNTADAIAREKEALYIQICEKYAPLSLAPGAENLLDRAKEKKIPMAIATSAGKENMHYYKKWFALSRYFSEDLIVMDDGKRKGKPEPDIYLEACKALGFEPNSCIVFEDTKSGIQSAGNAGVEEIYAIASPGADIETTKAMKHVHGLLSDFSQFIL
jgi:HAD superfamily hydrolase (TIGR01509 family)